MKVEIVLTETDITQEFAEAVEARDLPEKFFYWFPRSAAAWASMAQEAELYSGLRETWSQIATDAPEIAKDFGAKIPVISFGAGDGARDLLLIDGFKNAGRECLYFPVDASQAMLELACARAEDADVEATGIKADISSPVHLIYAADAADAPRLFIISGNTMGAFDPLAEIRYIAQCMKPGDRLIIDGEAYDEKLTMTRRSSPTAQKFLFSLLTGVGVREDEGELRFDHKRDERREGLHIITRHFRAGRDLSAAVAGDVIALQRGERIGMNFVYAYTEEAFRWLLCEQGGLTIVKEYRSPDARYFTAICRK